MSLEFPNRSGTPAAAAFPPRFHRLRVSDVRRETRDAVSIAFDVPEDLRGGYQFAPGQYLTLRATLDGEDLRRSYSICTAPADGELRIAVKRVEDGLFSSWANRSVGVGDEMDVMTPTGRFGAVSLADGARVYLGFAAGSGITPILSIVRGILSTRSDASFFLFYGNRSTDEMLFRETLEEMKDRYLGRLSVFHVLSKEQQDIDILNGRLDRDKVLLLMRHIVPAASFAHAFVCGPSGMDNEVEAGLLQAGLAREQVHVERFVSALGGLPRRMPAAPVAEAIASGRVAALVVDGKRTEIRVAEEDSVLDAALRAGLDLPYACKGGMCSTCRARVIEGSVRMDVNFSLEPWELQAGFVLTCQAHPTTERVVIDYDAM